MDFLFVIVMVMMIDQPCLFMQGFEMIELFIHVNRCLQVCFLLHNFGIRDGIRVLLQLFDLGLLYLLKCSASIVVLHSGLICRHSLGLQLILMLL